MELMDRALQREILERLAAAYPSQMQPEELTLGLDSEDRRWIFNATYLHEHGLIDAKSVKFLSGQMRVHLAAITARGLDFLQDDGGLSAMLGVVTVRLEAETLRALLEAKVQASGLPPEEKARITTALRDLGGEALKAATTRLVEAGMDHWPEALAWLQTLRG
ncbi:hypothetical protein [Caldimonas tepidiphila]|uniref:hypothetical protein n=1 Tax=Caldimonas tepidiphila TaxID=2315841 RepID=UPI000E5BB96E|nr:hypothetical protein [Caldimonas tepidiphila]